MAIRKIGRIVQRGRSWYVPVYLGRILVRDPATGAERLKEKRRWMRFDTYAQAREALPGLSDRGQKRALARTSGERLEEYLPKWLARQERINTKTRYEYDRVLTRGILPALGRVKLKDLEPDHIAHYLEQRRKAGLSAATRRRHFNLLNKALKDAVRMRRIPGNPADAVDRPEPAQHRPTVL